MTLARRNRIVTSFTVLLAAVGFGPGIRAQETSRAVLKTETHVVLVDAVVTNKKGEFIHDLTQKDFKVYEDNREQTISSLSFEADPTSPVSGQPHHLALFFDNTSIDLPYQKVLREAVAEFAGANADSQHTMAVIEFGPAWRITQDFTGDGERLKQAIGGATIATRTGRTQDSRASYYAIRDIVGRMAKLPGRKSLIILSGGMNPIDQDIMDQTMLACNKANVAVYSGGDLAGPRITESTINAKGAGAGKSTGGGQDNQQMLYSFAESTGGFMIYLKDLPGGLERINKEQNEYYLIGYSPENFEAGKCHKLKVKMAQSGMTVRSRSFYCPAKTADALAGTPVEKDLENALTGSAAGNVKASLQTPYFYNEGGTVRMSVALEVPTSAVQFEKRKGGRFHGQLNFLGIATRPDGGTAMRFSDTVNFDFEDKKAMETWQQKPVLYYEKDVEGVPGAYTLKMAVGSTGNSFAKVERSIAIDAYDGKTLGLSGIAFATSMHPIAKPGAAGADAVESEDNTPLIANGVQFFPSARTSFKTTETVVLFAEFYEPALKGTEIPKDLVVAARLTLKDSKTGAVKIDSGGMKQEQLRAGHPAVPMALTIPVDKLGPGDYTCELLVADIHGGQSKRVASFSVE
jgi:VWFA-related protein